MTQISIAHKSLEVHATVKNLTQRDLESFGAALSQEPKPDSFSQRCGANVRAAIKTGWFETITPPIMAENVSDQAPAVIRLLSDCVDRIYLEVTSIPPE